MQKVKVSDVDFNDSTGVVTLRGEVLTKYSNAARNLGVPVEELCQEALRDALKPENWPALHSAIIQRRG